MSVVKGAVLGWIVSTTGIGAAVTAQVAQGSMATAEQRERAVAILQEIAVTSAAGSDWLDFFTLLAWMGWSLGMLFGVLWNPWVQQVLHIVTDVIKSARERRAHEAAAAPRRPTLPPAPDAGPAWDATLKRFADGERVHESV